MLLELKRLEVPPGQRLLLQEVTWQEFETILEELGDHRGSRLAYDNGTLEIMMPLPEHEGDKEIVGDLIKVIGVLDDKVSDKTSWRILDDRV
jgi:Uma2 family endonuclease